MNLNDSNIVYKIVIYSLLFLLINSQQSVILLDSEYNCTFNLFHKFLIVKNEFNFNQTLKQYDFCFPSRNVGPYLKCDSNNRTVTYFNLPYTLNNNRLLKPSDINCFLNLKYFEIKNIKVLNNFLFKIEELPKSLNRIDFNGNVTNFLNIFKIDSSGSSNSDDYFSSNIQTILIKSGAIYQPLDIYFSNFKNLNYFEMGSNIKNTKLYPIIIHNDLNVNYNNKTIRPTPTPTPSMIFEKFKIISNNIPSMENIKITYSADIEFAFSITLLPNFQIDSFSNFSTFQLVGGIEIISPNKDLIYPFPISLFNNTSIQNDILIAINFDYTIDRISNFLNLSNFNELHWISIPNAGKLFNVDGKFPFSSLPKNLEYIEISNGNFSIPDFNSDDIFNKDIRIIKLSNNQMGGIIQKSLKRFENSNLKIIDLSNNELTGEIDESWCGFDFNIANNMIGGNAPQCITCHLEYEYYRIAGNQFVNIQSDTIPSCDLVINLSYDNQTKFFGIYGKNIGTYGVHFTIDGINNNQFNPNLKFTWKYQGSDGYSWNFKYIGQSSSDNPFGMNLTFPYLPQGVTTFQVTAYNHFQPLIYSISKYSNYFIINGKYFAYNQTVIQVLISNQQVCNVISSNFNTIQCYLEFDETTTTTTTNIATSTASVKIMDLISSDFKFSINDNDEVCNGINCPIPNCNVKYGKYNSNSGQCDCIKGWHGYTCDIKDLECPGCKEGNGVCNPIIGICKCNPNRIFNDCSGIKCIEECLNGGECNNSIGKCNCPSSNLWIGDSCNTPNISVSTQDQIISKSGIISTFIGWFGSTNNQLHIMINDSICDLLLFDPNTIKCLSPLNSTLCSGMSLTIIQNNFKWIGSYSTNVALNDQICLHHQNSSSSSEDSSNSTTSTSSNNNNNKFTKFKILLLSLILPILFVLAIIIIFLYRKYFKKLTIKYGALPKDDHDDDDVIEGVPLSNIINN